MFKIPESNRIKNHPAFPYHGDEGNNGLFKIKSPLSDRTLWIIASDGLGWEHVSIHATGKNPEVPKLPLWEEMCFIKDIFWDDEDVVMQLHPKKSEYINNHPWVLHLWRPTDKEIPTPHHILVGVKE